MIATLITVTAPLWGPIVIAAHAAIHAALSTEKEEPTEEGDNATAESRH